MVENTCLCHQCGHIFRLPSNACTLHGVEPQCPQCGSSGIRELPSWVPLGSDLSEGLREWEYECQHCHKRFKLPVPDSPSREKTIRCPFCDGGHIHKLTLTGFEPLYCG
jgi:DNA-directed RNA polymerase subunit RPC12/RpoP